MTVIKTEESVDNDVEVDHDEDVDFLPDVTNVDDIDEVRKPKRRGKRKRYLVMLLDQ